MSLYPSNLQKIGELEDIKIFSNDDIKTATISIIKESGLSNVIKTKMVEGLNKNVILVGYSKKDFSMLFHRIKLWLNIFLFDKSYSTTLGFCDPKLEKIAIILNDNVSITGNDIKNIEQIMLHEFIHLCAIINTNKFINIFLSKYIIPYYQSILYNIDEETISIPERDLYNLIKNLIKLNESKNFGYLNIEKNLILWFNIISKYIEQNKAKDITIDLFSPFRKNITKNLKSKYKGRAKIIESYFEDAYDVIKSNRADSSKKIDMYRYTYPGQEIFYPSEIIAVSGESGLIRNEINLLVKSVNLK